MLQGRSSTICRIDLISLSLCFAGLTGHVRLAFGTLQRVKLPWPSPGCAKPPPMPFGSRQVLTQQLPEKTSIGDLWSPLQRNSLASASHYTSQPYRAPELWHVTGDLRSLQKALTPAVDQWAFGAVLFEVCSGFMLMKPFDQQKSTKQTITDWCVHWADASSCCGARTGPKKSNHWSTRLLHCSRWGPLVVQACHPEARSRKWMKNRK